MDNQLTYMIAGTGLFLLLFIGYKILRRPRNYWLLFILSLGLAIFGLYNIDRPSLQMANGNAATWTLLPILFLITFGLLRNLFIKIYRNEPLMTGYYQTSWNQGEYRILHWGDAIFTILNVLVPFLVIMII